MNERERERAILIAYIFWTVIKQQDSFLFLPFFSCFFCCCCFHCNSCPRPNLSVLGWFSATTTLWPRPPGHAPWPRPVPLLVPFTPLPPSSGLGTNPAPSTHPIVFFCLFVCFFYGNGLFFSAVLRISKIQWQTRAHTFD